MAVETADAGDNNNRVTVTIATELVALIVVDDSQVVVLVVDRIAVGEVEAARIVADVVKRRDVDEQFSLPVNRLKVRSRACWRCTPRDMASFVTRRKTMRRKTIIRSCPALSSKNIDCEQGC